VSAPTRLDVLRWTDEHGNAYEHRRRVAERGPSLATIPTELRLVDAYCPSGHLTAVLSPNGDAPPIVMVHNPRFGPVPQLVLLPDGVAGATTWTDDDGRSRISAMSDRGMPSFEVDCATCVRAYLIEAEPLHQALRKRRPPRPARLRLAAAASD
jgi:hypothetical protein